MTIECKLMPDGLGLFGLCGWWWVDTTAQNCSGLPVPRLPQGYHATCEGLDDFPKAALMVQYFKRPKNIKAIMKGITNTPESTEVSLGTLRQCHELKLHAANTAGGARLLQTLCWLSRRLLGTAHRMKSHESCRWMLWLDTVRCSSTRFVVGVLAGGLRHSLAPACLCPHPRMQSSLCMFVYMVARLVESRGS